MALNKQEDFNLSSNNSSDKFNLADEISSYTKRWKWFVFSLVIFIGIAFVHLRYTIPEYNANAKIILFDNANTSNPASLLLNDLNRFSENESKKVQDEIEVLKSKTLMEDVVKKLSLNIQYSVKGRIHETQLYPDAPIKVNFFAKDSIIDISSYSFTIGILSDTSFVFSEMDANDNNLKERKISFGKKFDSPIGDLVILPNSKNILNFKELELFVKISPVAKTAANYASKINIFQKEEFSKVVEFSLEDPVRKKAQLIINTLIDVYIEKLISEKDKKSKNTADFIDNRIGIISSDLSDVDNEIQDFKRDNRLTDISSESTLYLNSNAQTDQELTESETQLSLVNYMKSYVDAGSKNFTAIPPNVGLADGSINNIALKYNDLLQQRNNLLNGSTKLKNPIIVNLDNQLNNLRTSLGQSLDNSSRSLKLQINELRSQSDILSSKLYSIPGQVRKSRDIERQQSTKESLFLFLLQKREEANISLTSNSSNVQIIDKAYGNSGGPVSPNRTIVFFAFIIIGFCIPFGIIYILNLFDTKIHNKEDLEREIKNITVLGEIPKLKAKTVNNVIKRNDRSILSESFRIIRTNFDYVSKGRNVDEYNNVIFVTSTIKGEGKSFFSINMALTLANTDKRVLLIGADIRNPKTHPSLKGEKDNTVSEIGLTEYLSDKSILVGEAINAYNVNGNQIDVMLSGKIPPNPAELLMNDRMKPLFDKVSEQYDYVIVDTAPSMLVTDTLLFSQYAGHTFYMTRAGYTEKRVLNFAKGLYANNKLNGMMLVVNGVDQSNFGYGATYGYSNDNEKKSSWFRRKNA